MSLEEFQQLVASYGLTAQERYKNFWVVTSDGYHYTPIGNPVTLNMSLDEWKSMLDSIARRKTKKSWQWMNEEEVKNYAVILDIHFITAFVEARGRHEALVLVLEALDHLHTQGLSHIEYGVREHKVYELIDLDKGQ